MDKVLYDLMDWAGIEEIVYSEAGNPERLLGPHLTEEGLVIQVFIPRAEAVTVKLATGGKNIRWNSRMRQDILQFGFRERSWRSTRS